MKSKNVGAVVAIAFVFISSIVFGAGDPVASPPGGGGGGGGGGSIRLPVQTQDELRNYALSIVKRGARGVSSPAIDYGYTGSVTYTEASGEYAEAVLDKLFSKELIYRVTNPNDPIDGRVWLYDAAGNQIFYGYARFTAASLAKAKPEYQIWLQEVPLLSGVSSAEVLALNEDDSTANRIPLRVSGGQLFFPPWMAGAPNGVLAVRFRDGSLAIQNLDESVGRSSTDSRETAGWRIPDHYAYTVGQESTPTVKVVAAFNRPTVFLNLNEDKNLLVDVSAMVQLAGAVTFVRPLALYFRPQEGGLEATLILSNTPNAVGIHFPMGKWRVRFDWPDGVLEPGFLYTGPASTPTTPIPVSEGKGVE